MRGVPHFAVSLALLVQAAFGSRYCSPNMCITTLTSGSNITYTLQSQHSLDQTGWMAIGTGSQMAGSSMVVVWPNTDGTVTVSQRTATGNVQPVLVSSPPSIATLVYPNNSLQSSKPEISFTMPTSVKMSDMMIWAFASHRPSHSSPSTTLHMHSAFGSFSPDTDSSGGASWTYSDKLIAAHAALASVGFLVVLPFGTLFARWARTFVPGAVWFRSHWILNLLVGGPLVVVGIALGYAAIASVGWPSTTHNTVGTVLLVLYLVQAIFGALIHFWKPVRYRTPGHRPPHHYAHPVLGLLIVGLAFWQVHMGYSGLFFAYTSHHVPRAVNIAWLVWVVVIPVAYFAGLVLLPRQFRQERRMREEAGGEHIQSPRSSEQPSRY